MTTQIQPVLTIDDLDCTPDDGNKYELIEGGHLHVPCAEFDTSDCSTELSYEHGLVYHR